MAKIAKAYLEYLLEQDYSMTQMVRKLQIPSQQIKAVCEDYGLDPPNAQGHRRTDKWASVELGLKTVDHDGMMRLARAVIRNTINDFKRCAESAEPAYENFFLSEWYELLAISCPTELNGNYIIKHVRKYKEEKRRKKNELKTEGSESGTTARKGIA